MVANKQNSGKTKVLPLFSTYGTFCSNDVLDAVTKNLIFLDNLYSIDLNEFSQ